MNPLIERLTAKGVVVTEFEGRGQEARQTWGAHFIRPKQRTRRSPYLWEDIVTGTDGCLVGTVADHAFERAGKWKAILFFQHSDDVLELDLTQAKPLTKRDLIVETMDYADVYIVDPTYTWTYVIPHEADWGPYFLSKFGTKGDH
ncbi:MULTISPECIES: DUF4275 family protein [Exiguobacterium]|uniref:DUF4275 family protein n=1 Tax=Exiguobacterium TaxID=33986 RepID=UPI001BE5C330|nr:MULTISPECIES: DUF4275 family protein [Exiguobacterium]MCT4777706.1 DUF4275 family protein [Exiguobacterium aquaticum]MCT4789766.1 DUF4275 family protein [Exiguobacterium mexicanum]